MFALILAAAAAAPVNQPAPNIDGISLDDVRWFGVSAQAAHANYVLAYHHDEHMRNQVRAWNHPKVAAMWETEVTWRRQCWSYLEDAANPNQSPAWRHERLIGLRHQLGEEAYYAGRMPDPTPKYRPWSP